MRRPPPPPITAVCHNSSYAPFSELPMPGPDHRSRDAARPDGEQARHGVNESTKGLVAGPFSGQLVGLKSTWRVSSPGPSSGPATAHVQFKTVTQGEDRLPVEGKVDVAISTISADLRPVGRGRVQLRYLRLRVPRSVRLVDPRW
jgi:hypothetical protein